MRIPCTSSGYICRVPAMRPTVASLVGAGHPQGNFSIFNWNVGSTEAFQVGPTKASQVSTKGWVQRASEDVACVSLSHVVNCCVQKVTPVKISPSSEHQPLKVNDKALWVKPISRNTRGDIKHSFKWKMAESETLKINKKAKLNELFQGLKRMEPAIGGWDRGQWCTPRVKVPC